MSAVVPVWADCGTDYDQAISMLDATKKKALDNEHPNPDDFSKSFQIVVDKLQGGKCLPELKNLINYIQAEQKKVPSAKPDKSTAPIVD
ncbi:MAG TPA: hypothetical protein V6C52_14475 [Coleofasciculaceae cyanobacterium]